jgi:signal transduction histidine kinase
MTSRLDNARLAVLVHEVRSPVAALSAVAETVAEPDRDDTARRELLRLAVAACHAIERVVLDVAVASIRLEVLDVGVLVHEAVASHVVRGNDVVVSEAEEGLVDGDPVRLRQAVDNLIANALVHGGESRVTVRATSSDDAVRIAVSDAGPGISSSEQGRIFELGVRLAGGAPGSGVGLALVRAIVEAHRGTVSVDSTPGSGSTFTIELPACSAHPDTRASSS